MPVTPGSTGASFDVLLAFSLDAEANRRVQQGVSTLEAELKRIQDEASGVGTEYEKSGEKIKKTSKEIAASLKQEARLMQAEAASIMSDLNSAQIQTLNTLSSAIGSASQKALLLGSALTVGIFAEVQRYVNLAPDATEETRAWAAETERLGKARNRVDAVLLREALPLLQKAAQVANQAAGFIEKNPEIVRAALNTGVVLAGLGAVGMLASRGIKLVADIRYLATIPIQIQAAKLQDLAADKMLLAAKAQYEGAGGSKPGGGINFGVIGLALTGLTLASSIILGVSKGMDELSKKLVEMGGFARAVGQGIQVSNHGLAPLIKNLLGLGDAADRAGGSVGRAQGRIMGGENDAAIVEAFSSWKEDDARLISEAADNRKKVIADTEKAIVDITRNLSRERIEINKKFNESRSDIISSFNEDNKQAEQDYQSSRSDLIREGQERIQELESSHLERLREIRKEAESQIEDASRSRDALALVDAQRRLVEETNEENRSFQLEKARARRETEQRIRELDENYRVERERRRAQFEADLRENEAERQEELARAAESAQAEIRQAREAQAQKLREIQEGLQAERLRRREMFLNQIRDLDASLIGETNLRRTAYRDMLKDAQDFFAQYRKTLPNTSNMAIGTIGTHTAPIRDSGGYANRGLYGLAMNGVPEFVLSGPTTSAAERAIGATLSDDALKNLFSRLGDMRSAVYNDNRRLEAPLSKDARRIYEESAKQALRDVLGAR